MTFPLSRSDRLRAGCAAGALLLAGPALAEIAAQEVRDEFQEAYETLGMTVEVGAEEAGDGTVTLSDVVLSFEFTDEGEEFGGTLPAEPDRTVRVEATFPEIVFTETPEGAVRATLPPRGEMEVTTTTAETPAVDTATLALLMDAAELLVSEGAPAAADDAADQGGGGPRSYALAADRLAAELVEATRAGEPVEGELVAALEGVSTVTTVPRTGSGPDETLRYTQTGEIAVMSLRMDLPVAEDPPLGGQEPAEPGRLVSIGDTRDIVLSGEGTVPGGDAFRTFVEDDDPSGALRAGLAGRLTLAYGSGTSEGTASNPVDPSQSFSVDSTYAGGDLEMSIGAEGLALSGTAGAVDYAVEGSGMPVPRIELGLEEGDFAFRLPLLEGEAGPFELRYLLAGLTVNEEVWALLDPEGRLARDPMTLLVGLDGRMRLLADIFDETAQAEADAAGEMPLEVEEASLEFRLAAVGADVEADGEFTFDNADTTTFPGMPAPTGTLNVVGSGIDALLDTLSEMGLVPPDQLMPARMMLGLFARSDGSGGYTSEIEVDGATGGVTANGQRLR